MLISIIILVKNEIENIGRCLEGVFQQQHPFDLEVIVIDSGSTDGTLDVVKQSPVRLVEIKSDEFHHAGTRNLGAALAKGEILVYIAGDAYPCGNTWLSSLISNFDDEKVGAGYGRQIPISGANPVNQFRLHWHYDSQKIVKSKESLSTLGPHKVYFFSDVNSAIRKSVWAEFKYPEDIPFYEDTGLIKKVIGAGYKVVYEPLASVYHTHNHSIIQIFRRYFDTAYIYNYLGLSENRLNSRINSEGIQFLKVGVGFIIRTHRFYYVPYFFVHTAAGFLGLTLGKHTEILPRTIKKLCSEHRL